MSSSSLEKRSIFTDDVNYFDDVSFSSGAPPESNPNGGLDSSTAEATSRFDLDSEVGFKVPGTTTLTDDLSDGEGGLTDATAPAKQSLRSMLAGKAQLSSSTNGLLELCAAKITVVGTPLHARIEKKASSLIGGLAKLVQTDLDFKALCRNFAEKFESLSGAPMRQSVSEFLDVIMDSYELTEDQAVFCTLLTATARLRKLGTKGLHNAEMTMRILGSVVSASDRDLPSRLKAVSSGELQGDLTGGDRAGVMRFSSANSSTLSSVLFVAWLDFISKISEDGKSLEVMKATLFMQPDVDHELWQKVTDGSLENILITAARFTDKWDDFQKFQDRHLGINLLPSDAYGKAKMFWHALHPVFLKEIKEAARMSAMSGSPVRWIDKVPVFEDWEDYVKLFQITWDLFTATGYRVVAARKKSTSPLSTAALTTAPNKRTKECWHWKKFGECKFGTDSCKGGLHSPEHARKVTAVMPVSTPAVPAVPPVGSRSGTSGDAVTRDCKRCKTVFTESTKHWMEVRRVGSMPTHCEACRKVRKEERIALNGKPPITMPAEVAPDCGETTSAPDGVSMDSWDEVLRFADEDTFEFMICSSDHAVSEEHSSHHCMSALSVGSSVSTEPVGSPVRVAWAKGSLNDSGLAVTSLQVMSSFGDEMQFRDRRFCASGTVRTVQICVTDGEECMMAVDSDDCSEVCLPGSELDCKVELDQSVLSDVLFNQSGIFTESFGFLGYAELKDDFGDNYVWYYFTAQASEKDAKGAMTEEGSPVFWLERFQWDMMDKYRATEAACFFNLRLDSELLGFDQDALSSEEYEYAMGESADAVGDHDGFVWNGASNSYGVLSQSAEPVEVDVPADGSEEDLEDPDKRPLIDFSELNSAIGPTPAEEAELFEWLLEVDQAANAGPGYSSSGCGSDGSPGNCPVESGATFDAVVPLILEHGIAGDAESSVFVEGRLWKTRKAAALSAVKSVLSADGIRTPTRKVTALASAVSGAVEIVRFGCARGGLSDTLAATLAVDPRFTEFASDDIKVVACAASAIAANASRKLYTVAVADLSEVLSKLSLVCSGSRADVRLMMSESDIIADARKRGIKKQLTIQESLMRTAAQSMFADPSYQYAVAFDSGVVCDVGGGTGSGSSSGSGAGSGSMTQYRVTLGHYHEAWTLVDEQVTCVLCNQAPALSDATEAVAEKFIHLKTERIMRSSQDRIDAVSEMMDLFSDDVASLGFNAVATVNLWSLLRRIIHDTLDMVADAVARVEQVNGWYRLFRLDSSSSSSRSASPGSCASGGSECLMNASDLEIFEMSDGGPANSSSSGSGSGVGYGLRARCGGAVNHFR